jgi:cytochrome c oxidase assembly factor CtaG
MLSILSGLLGIASSGLPSILQFFQQKGDQKHEMAMAKLQNEREMAMAQAGFLAQQKIEEIRTDQIEMQTYAQEREALYNHDMKLIEKASQSVVDMNARVRPLIAYIFVGLLVFVDVAGLIWAIYTGVDFNTAMTEVFSDDEMAIVSSIIGFYFGSRQWEKMRESK